MEWQAKKPTNRDNTSNGKEYSVGANAGENEMTSAKTIDDPMVEGTITPSHVPDGSKPKTEKATPVRGVKGVREVKEEPEEKVEASEERPSEEIKGKTKEEAETPGLSFAPKTFLQPYMLLLLRDWNMHGYEVWERLMKMGFPGFDQNDRATVYRALRQLEKEGKVRSEWDTRADGPARRVYSLTDAGEEFLKMWAGGLDQYRKTLDFFFKLYTGGMVPSPFDLNALSGNDKKRK